MIEPKRSVGKGQIIHTSLKEMNTVQSDFPNSEPTPGVLARAVYHHGTQKVVVEIYHESPLIISPGKGEFIDADPDTVDNEVRKLILSIAERCQSQGEDLINHAQRLLDIASKEVIIDEIDQESVRSKAGYTGQVQGSIGSISRDINTVSATGSSKKGTKQVSSRVKNEDLLSMLADDDEDGEGEGIDGKGSSLDTGDTEDIEEDDDMLNLLLEED